MAPALDRQVSDCWCPPCRGRCLLAAGWFLRGTVRTQRLPLPDPLSLTSSPSHLRNGRCDFGVHESPVTRRQGSHPHLSHGHPCLSLMREVVTLTLTYLTEVCNWLVVRELYAPLSPACTQSSQCDIHRMGLTLDASRSCTLFVSRAIP